MQMGKYKIEKSQVSIIADFEKSNIRKIWKIEKYKSWKIEKLQKSINWKVQKLKNQKIENRKFKKLTIWKSEK